MSTNVGSININVNIDASAARNLDKQIRGALQGATNSAKGLSTELNKVERSASRATKPFITLRSVAGRALSAFSAISAARGIVRFVDSSVDEFNRLEKGIIEIQSLLGEGSRFGFGQEGFQSFQAQIEQISERFGSLTKDVVPAFYQAISSGIAEEDVQGFVGIADTLAQVGLTTLDQAVDGLTAVTNAYAQFEGGAVSAGRAADVLFTTVQGGRLRFEELAKFIGQVTPIASQAGVSLEEVSAGLVAITKQGIPVRKAATFLRQAFIELGRDGTRSAQAFQEATGENFRDFLRNGGNIVDVFTELDRAARASGNIIANSFNSIEASQAASALTANTLAFRDALIQAEDAQNKVASAALEFARTNEGQLQILTQEAESERLALGEGLADTFLEIREIIVRTLLPAVSAFAEAIGPGVARNFELFSGLLIGLSPIVIALAQGFSLLPPEIAQLVISFKIIQGLGALKLFTGLLSPVGKLGTGIKTLGATFIGLRRGLDNVSGATIAWNRGLSSSVNTVLPSSTLAVNSLRAGMLTLGTAVRAVAASIGRFLLASGPLIAFSAAIAIYSKRSQEAAERQRNFTEGVKTLTRTLRSADGQLDLSNESIQRFIAGQDSIFNEERFENKNFGKIISEIDGGYQGLVETLGEVDGATIDLLAGFDEFETRSLFDDENFVDSFKGGIQIGGDLKEALEEVNGELDLTTDELFAIGQINTFEELADFIENDLNDKAGADFLKLLNDIEQTNPDISSEDTEAFIDALGELQNIKTEAAVREIDNIIAANNGATSTFQELKAQVQQGIIDPDAVFDVERAGEIMVAAGEAGEAGFGQRISLAAKLASQGMRAVDRDGDGVLETFVDIASLGGEAAKAVDGITSSFDNLQSAIDRLNSDNFDIVQARIDQQEAVADLTDAVSADNDGFDFLDDRGQLEGLLARNKELAILKQTTEGNAAAQEFLNEKNEEALELIGPTGVQQALDETGVANVEELITGLGGATGDQFSEGFRLELDLAVSATSAAEVDAAVGKIVEGVPPQFERGIANANLISSESLSLPFFLNTDLITEGLNDPALVADVLGSFDTLVLELNERIGAEGGIEFLDEEDIRRFQPLLDAVGLSLEEFASLDPEVQLAVDDALFFEKLGLAEVDLTEFDSIPDIVKGVSFKNFTPNVLDDIITTYGRLRDAPDIVKSIFLRASVDSFSRQVLAGGGNIPGVNPDFVEPRFGADGGIFNRATNMIIGEAGKEVLVPLTRPNRARQLVKQSGLLDVIGENGSNVGNFKGGNTKSISVGDTVIQVDGANADEILARIEAYEQRRFNRYRRG